MNDPRLFPGAGSALGRLQPADTAFVRSGFVESTAAGFAAEAANDLADQHRLLRDAYQPLVNELGLANPYDMGGDAQVVPERQEMAIGEVWRQADLRRGEIAGIPRSREELEKGVLDSMRASQRLAEELEGRAGVAGTIGSFLGRAGGALADPANQLSMLLGAPARAGLARLVLTEAVVGAASNVATRPQRSALADELGVEMPSFAEEALLGAAFGGGFAGALRGGQALAGLTGRQLARLFDGQVPRPTPEQRAAREALQRAEDIADASPLADTAGGRAEHLDRLSRAVEAVERLQAPAMPDRPLRPAMAPAGPGGFIHGFDPDELSIDARTFQFKGGGDAEGVSDRLQGVTKWDEAKAGQILVWESADGRRFVADGHQRVGLAKRLAGRGDSGDRPKLYGLLYREADGYSASDVRVIAAMKNIAEGTGTAVDAAKVLREAPERVAELPPRSELVRQAKGLSRLSDTAFGMVANDVVPARYAAMVGDLVPTELQPAILDLLARADPANVTQAEAMVRQALAAGTARETQLGLFGEEEIVRSLYTERARVLDRVLKDLRKDRRVFAVLAGEGGRIEQAGNVLAAETNAARKVTDERAIELLQKLANSVGPIADALNAAARAYSETGRLGDAAAAVGDAVRRAAADADRDWLSPGGSERALGPGDADAPPPGSAAAADEVARFDAPAGEGQLEQVADLAAELLAPQPARPAPDPAEAALRLDEAKGRQPFDDVAGAYELAEANQTRLGAAVEAIAGKLGVKFKNPGIKARATSEEKMARKGYRSARHLTDIVRGGFIVRTAAEADGIVAELGRQLDVIDEGWSRTKDGYVDRKVMVVFPDGMIGEVQIFEQSMLAAKSGGGHRLYTESRSLSPDDPRRGELEQQQRELYSAALAKADSSIGGLFPAAASAGANMRSNTAGSTSYPDSPTSTQSTSVQLSSQDQSAPRSTAQARSPSRTAGRPSQLTSSMSGSPASDMGVGADAAKPQVPQQAMDAGLFGRAEPEQASLVDPDLDTVPIGEQVAEDGSVSAASMTRDEMAQLIEADAEFAQTLEAICRVAP